MTIEEGKVKRARLAVSQGSSSRSRGHSNGSDPKRGSKSKAS